MARQINGYAIITDQGDSKVGRPVKYLLVRFPAKSRELRTEQFYEVDDIYNATIFNINKPQHRQALGFADLQYPNAVPVKVTVIRTIQIHPEIPE